MHTVLIPPLLCSPLVYAHVLDDVWRYGEVSVADTRSDDTIAEMAERILRRPRVRSSSWARAWAVMLRWKSSGKLPSV